MKTNQLKPIDKQERFLVTQSNDLVEANYSPDLTAQALKTARLILSLISPDDEDLRLYTIDIDALKQYLGLKKNTRWGAFYSRLKQTAMKLNKEPIEIRKPDGKYLVANLISAYEVDSINGKVTFEISGLLKPYLLELRKNYTSYLLAYIPKLKSSYSIRLYELLYQYRKIGKRSFELIDLQKKVGSNYNMYGDFKRKVILQAQKDLKKHTDLAFAFTERKEGRKVAGVEFIIFSNTPVTKKVAQLPFLEPVEAPKEKPAFQDTIIKAMNALGISEQNIAKYLAKGFEVISGDDKKKAAIIKRCKTLENYYLEKLELTKKAANRDNAAGYFIKALKEDWTVAATTKKAKTSKLLQETSNAQNKYNKLQRLLVGETKKKKALEISISQELAKDNTLLQKAYKKAFASMSTFVKNQINALGEAVLSLPIEEQYQQSFKIRLYVDMELKNLQPKKFLPVIEVNKKLNALKKEIAELRERYNL